MKNIIFFSLLVFCIPLFSQNTLSAGITNVDSVFAPKLTGETFTEYKRYKGNQFLTDDWMESEILLTTGQVVHNKNIKYNGLLDQVIWLNPVNSNQVILDKLSINEFRYKNMMGETVHFRRIDVVDTSSGHHLQVFAEAAVEGKISFYIQHRIMKTETENIIENKMTYNIDVLDSKPIYYIKTPSGSYFAASHITKYSFLKLFPEQRKAITKILNKNHLNFRTETAIINTIEVLNKDL